MNESRITSIGCLAGQLQTPVSKLQEIAAALGIIPTSTINNAPYFDAADVERIAERIRSEQPGVIQ